MFVVAFSHRPGYVYVHVGRHGVGWLFRAHSSTWDVISRNYESEFTGQTVSNVDETYRSTPKAFLISTKPSKPMKELTTRFSQQLTNDPQ